MPLAGKEGGGGRGILRGSRDREVRDNVMRGEGLPTLEDVARDSGVSTATVSRCLNDPSRVALHTRERVLASIASLGYSPNFGARALAAKRTNTFGAVIPTMDSAIFARGLQAFQDELGRNDATLLVSSSSYDPEIEERQVRTMIARGADGLLLIGRRRGKSVERFLARQGVPVVIAWTIGKAGPHSVVGFDNAAGAAALARRAIELGHRRFAFLSGERRANDRAADRVLGVRRALRAHGLDPDALAVEESPYAIAEAGEAFRRLVETRPRPSIVMCGNDVQAVGALMMARELGLSVPGDVSVTGFDDIELATVVAPALTTVHVPHRDMGRRAAEVLLAHVRGVDGPRRVKLPTRLVERDSLAAPPD